MVRIFPIWLSVMPREGPGVAIAPADSYGKLQIMPQKQLEHHLLFQVMPLRGGNGHLR